MLAVMAMAILLVVVVGFSQRFDEYMRVATHGIDQRQADHAVDAGIARALAALTDANVDLTTTTDEWYSLGQNGSEEFVVGPASFRIQIIDATRLVNLNTADEEHLRRFNLSDEQVDSLLDWRNLELQPRPQGAKDEYYNSLTVPYNTKLRGLDSLSELLLVKGFTAATLFEPPENLVGSALSVGNIADQPPLASISTVDSTSPNTRADGTERVNLNVAQNAQLVQAGLRNQAAQAIIQRRGGGFTSMNEVFSVPGLNIQDAEAILNVATITNETTLVGKININTAPETVLRTIPNLSEDQIQGIISRQGTFQSLGELAQSNGFTTNALAQVANYFTAGASTFIVRVEGRRGTASSFMEAVVEVTEGVPRVIKMYRPLSRLPRNDWGWEDEPSTQTVLMESQ